MVNENLIPKTEIVSELKEESKIPSFEEFMKDYKDSNLNYDDLSNGSVGEVKGYGPCTSDYCSCSNYELRQQLRQAKEELDNFWEKFKEYDGKWERYRTFVEGEERSRERDENIQTWGGLITEVASAAIPIPFLGSAISASAAGFTSSIQVGTTAMAGWDKKSIYKEVCDKYYEIKDWYWRVRNKF